MSGWKLVCDAIVLQYLLTFFFRPFFFVSAGPQSSPTPVSGTDLGTVPPTTTNTDSSSDSDSDATPEPAEEAPDCFPSGATVELASGSIKKMGDLRLGDVVKVGQSGEFSEIYFFSHHHANQRASVISLETDKEGMPLQLSPGHLLKVNGKLQAARSVRVGDTLYMSAVGSEESSSAVVTRISRRVASGLHNPHTLHGDIVVNGVLASTFTKAVHPAVARTLLLPVRAVYRAVGAHWGVEAFNDVVMRAIAWTYWTN